MTDVSTWQSVLGKLRLWELTEYDRICFLDGDTVLTRPLDGIFDDPAVETQAVGTDAEQSREDEGPLPSHYVFAGIQEMMITHRYPPTEENHDWPNFGYLNAGIFVLKPNLQLLDYYLSLADTPDRFPPQLPEQNLLNYAHRPEGNMPWKHCKYDEEEKAVPASRQSQLTVLRLVVATHWNMHYPDVADLEGGVASLHEKWWSPVHPALNPYLLSWRWRMKGFHEARDIREGFA